MKSVFRSPSISSLGLLNISAAAIYAFASLGATGAKAQVPPTITCSAPTTVAGGTANGLIAADTPSADSTRIFASVFNIKFVTNAPSADKVNWSVQDYLGSIRGSGSFAVPAGTQTSTLSCTSKASGYFVVTATLNTAGGTLPQAGTRPMGIATFGVLPNVSATLPAPTFANQDQHRFGLQGANDKPALLAALGVTQDIDWRQLSTMEPNGPNTWTPSLTKVDASYKSGQISRLVRLDGIPAWASPTGAFQDDTMAPTDLSYYQNYMARVGADSEAIRQAYYPNQRNNYYQVTWEPNWLDTPDRLVSMYQAVYQGIHSKDPNAVVMATASAEPGVWCMKACTGWMLQYYAALGLGKYIDGVTTHSYYNAPYSSPAYPPEQHENDPNPGYLSHVLARQMRDLRAQMQQIKPNMRLWSTEVGISYDPGAAYGPYYPSANQLYAQAAVAVRTHLIVLGEGAQVTYFFYASDYPTEVGYGIFFDIVNSKGAFHAQTLSPKPEALAFAALTRIIDGTETLGRLNGLPQSIYGYAFQRLGNGPVVTALWTHNNANWPVSGGGYSATAHTSYSLSVDSPGTSGTVTVLDMMGNPTRMSYTNGVVNLTLTETPIYVVSSNASLMRANVTAPVGYTGQ